MKTLLISRHHLCPEESGAAQRSDIICRALASFSEVDLIVLSEEDKMIGSQTSHCRLVEKILISSNESCRLKGVGVVSRILNRIYVFFSPFPGFYYSPRISEKVHQTIECNQYDAVVVRYLNTFSLCALQKYKNVVVDIDDLPEDAYRTMVGDKEKNGFMKCYRRYKLDGIKMMTKKIIRRCAHVWVSNPDQLLRCPNFSCLPNIPYPFFCSSNEVSGDVEHKKSVLFVGLMSYFPNQEAVDFFIQKVWPIVLSTLPDTELRIVGGGLPSEIIHKWKKTKGVTLMGYVKDLAKEYKNCAFAVAPIFSGSGTNIKVLEALKYGRPCIASSFATRGFAKLVHEGGALVVCQTAEEFAARAIELLQNEALSIRLGVEAKECMEKFYGFHVVRDHIERTIKMIVNA